MGKDIERKAARQMYVEQGKTASEIAALGLGSEKTIGVWVKKFGWKEQRNAFLNSQGTRLENIQRVIDDLVEQRLELSKQIKEATEAGDKKLLYDLNRQAVALSDEVSKYNKSKNDLLKAGKITLEKYLEVMTLVFDAMRKYDQKLFNTTLDFQELHIEEASKLLA